MKKLMTLALIALLSFGVASVSWAQEGAGQAAGAAAKTPKAKKHKGKKKKKSSKGMKDDAAAAPQ